MFALPEDTALKNNFKAVPLAILKDAPLGSLYVIVMVFIVEELVTSEQIDSSQDRNLKAEVPAIFALPELPVPTEFLNVVESTGLLESLLKAERESTILGVTGSLSSS